MANKAPKTEEDVTSAPTTYRDSDVMDLYVDTLEDFVCPSNICSRSTLQIVADYEKKHAVEIKAARDRLTQKRSEHDESLSVKELIYKNSGRKAKTFKPNDKYSHSKSKDSANKYGDLIRKKVDPIDIPISYSSTAKTRKSRPSVSNALLNLMHKVSVSDGQVNEEKFDTKRTPCQTTSDNVLLSSASKIMDEVAQSAGVVNLPYSKSVLASVAAAHQESVNPKKSINRKRELLQRPRFAKSDTSEIRRKAITNTFLKNNSQATSQGDYAADKLSQKSSSSVTTNAKAKGAKSTKTTRSNPSLNPIQEDSVPARELIKFVVSETNKIPTWNNIKESQLQSQKKLKSMQKKQNKRMMKSVDAGAQTIRSVEIREILKPPAVFNTSSQPDLSNQSKSFLRHSVTGISEIIQEENEAGEEPTKRPEPQSKDYGIKSDEDRKTLLEANNSIPEIGYYRESIYGSWLLPLANILLKSTSVQHYPK